MDRFKKALARTLGGVFVALFLFPAVANATDHTITVGYTEKDDCPDRIFVDPAVLYLKWKKDDINVIWKESGEVASDKSEWTVTWTQNKSKGTEYSHFPATMGIPTDKNESAGNKPIAANAPNAQNTWIWTYAISVKKEACDKKTLDPAIIFRDGSGGATNFVKGLLALAFLLVFGGSGYYFGKKFADH